MLYLNIHAHSEYSLQDGLPSVKEYVKKAKEMGNTACCITDHGNCNSYAELWMECNKQGIKPIIAAEFYYIDDHEKWHKENERISTLKGEEKKLARKKARKNYHIILIAKNKAGLKNLFLLNHEANKNFHYRPRLDKKLIKKYSNGLICTTACLANSISQHLLNHDEKKAMADARFFKNIFGDDLYIEIQFNELEEQKSVNSKLCQIAKKIESKVVIGTDSHYLNKEDYETHRTLLLMQSGKTYRDLEEGNDGVWEFDTKQLFYKSYRDVRESWRDFHPNLPKKYFIEGCKSTLEIEKKVRDYEIDTSTKLKDITPEIKDKNKYLKQYCLKELKKRGLLNTIYKKRLKRELEVIEKKGFANYFVFVQNIILEMEKEMLIGTGRGSAAGSLVCYLMGIVKVDPIKYGLLFERFLDESRSEYPDIDCDVADNDRVKEWIMDKYGDEAACISLYSTFQISMLIKDLIRTYGIDTAEDANKLTKKIKSELASAKDEDGEEIDIDNFDLDSLYDNSPSLQEYLDSNERIKHDLRVMLGKIRHVGKHAAGVVLADNLNELQPLSLKDGVRQTALEEGGRSHISADMGFIKVDILGLKTLKVLHKACQYIAKDKGVSVKKVLNKIDSEKIDFDNKKVYEKVFKKGDLTGIFQCDTEGGRKLIKKVKPTSLEDLTAINALNRPGPLRSGMAFDYADLKNGKKEPDYFGCEKLKEILEPTHSILVFQEQQMQIMNKVGEVDLVTTNKVRKWFSKKMADLPEVKKELVGIKKQFMSGSKKNGMSKDNAEIIWERMYNFAKYSFNKSHSLCYSVISFQCAWIKTYFPAQFYTALLNVVDMEKQSGGKKINVYEGIIHEAKRNDIHVKKLDLNNSKTDFTYKGKEIYWGYSKANGIGEKQAVEIMRSLDEDGKIKNLSNFLTRDLTWRIINKRVVENLINSGCFNSKKTPGEKLLLEFYTLYNARKKKKEAKESGFIKKIKKEAKKNLDEKGVSDYHLSLEEKSKMELQVYKMNLEYSPFILRKRDLKINELEAKGKAGSFFDKKQYYIAAIRSCRIAKDRRKQDMAFITIMDKENVIKDALVFSSNYREELEINGVYAIQGKFSPDGKLLVDAYTNLDSILNRNLG